MGLLDVAGPRKQCVNKRRMQNLMAHLKAPSSYSLQQQQQQQQRPRRERRRACALSDLFINFKWRSVLALNPTQNLTRWYLRYIGAYMNMT